MAKSKFWSEFRDFAMKGNVIDLAVGVIVGGAFGKIVTSFSIFLAIKGLAKLQRKKKEEASAAPAVPAPKPDDVVLLEEIRDLLKNQK